MYDDVCVDEQTGKATYRKYEKDIKGGDSSFLTTDYTIFSSKDRVLKGKAFPDVYGSWDNSFSWKGITLSIILTYSIGGLVYDDTYQSMMAGGSTPGENFHRDNLNAWTETNTRTSVPRLDYLDQNVAGGHQDGSLMHPISMVLPYNLNINSKKIAR